MMNGFLFFKKKKEQTEKKIKDYKNLKNYNSLKQYNNEIVKNHYNRVTSFINEMNKSPIKLNYFNPLTKKFNQMTNRDKNINTSNKISFKINKTDKIKPIYKNIIEENLEILYNIKDINFKNKEVNNLYKIKNKFKTLGNKKNLKNNFLTKLNKKTPNNKKTFFESVITIIYKNKDILKSNIINKEENISNKSIYLKKDNINKISKSLAINMLIKCNKFKKKYNSINKVKKPFVIKNI